MKLQQLYKLFIIFGLSSSLAKADVIGDIGRIANSNEVAAFLAENNLQAKSIAYYLTMYCAGGPSNFLIRTNQPDKCVWVQVGSCDLKVDPAQVKVLSTASNLKCD